MDRKIEVFSTVDLAFTRQAKEIMEKVSVKVRQKYKGYNNTYDLYTIPKVFFTEDSTTHIACYTHDNKTIYINTAVQKQSVDYFTQIVLHEYAHYVAVTLFNFYGHGDKFKEICACIDCKFNTPYAKSKETLSTKSELESKIFKLLKLSESSNINESASALNKARKLMVKANITLTEKDKLYRVSLYRAKRITMLYKAVFAVVGKSLGISTTTIRGEEKANMVAHGTKEQLEIACYMFDCLLVEFKKQLESARKSYNIHSVGSFYSGMYATIINTFTTDIDITTALTLSSEQITQKADELLYSNYRTTKSKTHVSLGDYAMGQQYGGKVSLYKGKYTRDSGKYLA